MIEIMNILMEKFNLPHDIIDKIFYKHKGLQHPIIKILKNKNNIIRLKMIPTGLKTTYYYIGVYGLVGERGEDDWAGYHTETQKGFELPALSNRGICLNYKCMAAKRGFKYCSDCISMKPYNKNEYPYGRRRFDNMFNL